MKINTNISAIIANKELRTTENALSLSLERLSSGFKINHSKDDAAGMAISQKMKTQLRGLDRANKNAADGVSVIETAEGALTEIHSMLQRMRELAVGAASDTNCQEDREALQKEVQALNEEIDRISRDTEFNMQSLIDGNLARRAYADTNGIDTTYLSENIPADIYGITVTQDAKQATVVGGAVDRAAFGDEVTEESGLAGSIKINDVEVKVEVGDTFDEVITKVQAACTTTSATLIGVNSLETSVENVDTAGYTKANMDSATNLVIYSNAYGDDAKVEVTSDNEALLSALGLSETVVQGKDVEAEFMQSNGERVGFDAAATITANGREVIVKSIGGFEMKILTSPGVAQTQFDGTTGEAVSSTSKDVKIDVTNLGMMVVHVGANENQELAIDIPEITSRSLNLQDLNIRTFDLAGDAITRIDEAISTVSITRSRLGAYQNRLEYSMSNLDISEENLTASLSRITDVDMAEEMTQYTQQNVLSQAGVSMLSQANARPESVLQLLQ